jgi:hypothetical protein
MAVREITRATQVAVTLGGEQGSYALGGLVPGPISTWAPVLSDLTGFTAEHIESVLVTQLANRDQVLLQTAAGDRCPVRFRVALVGPQ